MTDQAEGLRRLFGRNFVRVIAFTGAAQPSTQSSLVAGLSRVLAQRGKRVLVIDERRDPGVFGAWQLVRRGDLVDVMTSRKSMGDILSAAPGGVLALSAARGLTHASESEKKQESLLHAFRDWDRPLDIVLIDTPHHYPDAVAVSFMPAAHDIVNLVNPEARAITEAYAIIKRMTQQGSRAQFHVLFHRVGNDAEAQTIFANMLRASRSYLDISLNFLGVLTMAATNALADRAPASSAAGSVSALESIADAIEGWPLPSDDLGPLDSFLHRWMQNSRSRPKEIRY